MSQYLCHAMRFQNIHHQELGSCISEAITKVCDIFPIKILEKYLYTYVEILHLPLVPFPAC